MMMQSQLIADTSAGGRLLELDFPSLHIGVAQYSAGPTGVTVFRFARKAVGCVDVRGGAPGAYNVDWLRLGYSHANLDAVVVSGGSWYGLAAAGGAAAALKDSGERSGHWTNLANVAGAIIYDFGERRPNEIHPDEKLGAAALRAARPGRFPQGAQGAGRMAMQGSYFGLWLHSGQGGAFRELDRTKIACFAVVNAVGVVVDRKGRLCCGRQSIRTGETTINELITRVPASIRTLSGSIMGRSVSLPPNPHNTTISLVVTNQKLNYAELQRLAVQVHTSMARAIQPFATLNDGDVLFAASTGEVGDTGLHPTDLGTVASEVMWDAILNSVPDIDDAAVADGLALPDPAIAAGHYRFGEALEIAVRFERDRLVLENTGERDIFGLAPGALLQAAAGGDKIFETDSPYLARFGFTAGVARPRLVLNPGPWQQASQPD